MKNVAALSGVSYQTVSRVINGMPDVSDRTRKRVQKVMKKVGFRPNMTARQLRSRRSTTVGLVTFATGYYGPSQVLTNSEQCVKELGFGFMFSGIVEESIDEIRRAVDELCAYQVCGILIHLPLQVDLRDLQDLSRNVPFVAVDSDFGFQAPSVVIDNEMGSRIATRHLIERHHREDRLFAGTARLASIQTALSGLAEGTEGCAARAWPSCPRRLVRWIGIRGGQENARQKLGKIHRGGGSERSDGSRSNQSVPGKWNSDPGRYLDCRV